MDYNEASRLLGELRQLVDRWELELGAKPVWWRRYPAVQTNDAREKSKTSAASPRAPAKSRNEAKSLNSQRISAPRRAAAADTRRVAGQ
jgi:hypothetical protein